jgi:hypothetical protein
MPYKIIAHKDGSYSVKNTYANKIVAKHTTKAKAEAQVRLLHMLEGRGKK